MHELSVLVKACDLAERAAIDNNVEHVKYIMKNEGRCPKCGSRKKTILSGTEFFVKDIGY